MRTEDGTEHTVPAGWAAHRLDHGYALTCHKAQGLTVDIAHLYGTAGLYREAGYVGLSRGRQANYLYATTDSLTHAVDPDTDHARRAEPDRPVARLDQQLLDRLASGRAQQLALDQLGRTTRRPNTRAGTGRRRTHDHGRDHGHGRAVGR